MATCRYVSQKLVSSKTNWVMNHVNKIIPYISKQEVEDKIVEYFSSNPSGEDVTLWIMDSLGPKRLETLSKKTGNGLRWVTRTLGSMIAIIASDMYPIETNRCVSSNKNCTTQAKDSDAVSYYTKHRIIDV